jgi:hypothetical protein
MKSNKLENLTWYKDSEAEPRGEPGIYHSFMKSLATAIYYIDGKLDPTWLMGTSGFAFRSWVNEVMCPSAMSVFDFSSILPEAIEQAGYHAIHISRFWNEADKESERRAEAQAAIIEGINRGVPAIVWDIAEAEWGLIKGYDLEEKIYHTLTHNGKSTELLFDKLGRNGINILSVAIPGEVNQRNRELIIRNSLTAAVNHAEQKEWTDRPKYQNGLPAYDLWASLFEKWAMLIEAGKGENIHPDIWNFATYYAGHYYSARCYAREYLKWIANGNDLLIKAASCYANVSSALKPVWDYFSQNRPIDAETLHSLTENIKRARAAEGEGINFIKEYLDRVGDLV